MTNRKNKVIALLVLLNIFLLYRIYSVNAKIESLPKGEQALIALEYYDDLEKELVDYNLISPDSSAQFSFIVLFRTHDCSDCVYRESVALNKIYTSGTPLFVYCVNDGISFEDFKKLNNFHFPLHQIEKFDTVIDGDIDRTPAVLVVKNGAIVDSYISIPMEHERHKKFFDRWERILNIQ